MLDSLNANNPSQTFTPIVVISSVPVLRRENTLSLYQIHFNFVKLFKTQLIAENSILQHTTTQEKQMTVRQSPQH